MEYIKVHPSVIVSSANTMETAIAEYETIYKNLISTVETTLKWEGIDAKSYITQVQGFKDDFQSMVSILKQYVELLKECSSTYVEVQDYLYQMGRQL